MLNDVVVRETRHLVRTCIHDAVLAKLKRDQSERVVEALIDQCVREVVVSTLADVERAAAVGMGSDEVGATSSSSGREASGVQQAGCVLKALVADQLLERYLGTAATAPVAGRQDMASLWPVLLAMVADQLLRLA